MIKGGVLEVVRNQGIFVRFGNLTWMKPHHKQQEIIDYWHSQGFAEAEPLPYSIDENCLTVTRDLPEYGFQKGSGTLSEQIYNIPF